MTPRPSQKRRLSNVQIGLIVVVLTTIGFYLAFSKSLPFSGDGYTVKAVFQDAQSIRANSPVRIAGVDVGKVTSIEHLLDEDGNGRDAAVITMTVEDEARPIKEDATLQLRPRLFLEGNLFVDVQPGSPSADELSSGGLIPLEQTAVSVQLDQVLTGLQQPVRENLQVFLKQFGDALDRYGGAAGFRESFRTSPKAYRATAQVNEALLGTQPGDLVGVVRNLGDTVRALDQNEAQLQDLVTNLRIVTGSFASERQALEEGIAELPQALAVGRPALAKLNDALPPLRAFSREALPGVRAADRMLPAATPFLAQLRALVSKEELRGLVKDLRPTVPDLARLAKETLPLLEETRELSSCFNSVVIPWSNLTIPAASDDPDLQVFKETGYSLAGVAGESRSGDAQGQWFRVLGGGGTNSLSFLSTDSGPTAGVTPFSVAGAQPAKQSSAKTPFHSDVACETQDVPDLSSEIGDVSATTMSAGGSSSASESPAQEEAATLAAEYAEAYKGLLNADQLEATGQLQEAEALREQSQAALAQFNKLHLDDYRQAILELTGGGD